MTKFCKTKNHRIVDHYTGLGTLLLCGKKLEVLKIGYEQNFVSCPFCSTKLTYKEINH